MIEQAQIRNNAHQALTEMRDILASRRGKNQPQEARLKAIETLITAYDLLRIRTQDAEALADHVQTDLILKRKECLDLRAELATLQELYDKMAPRMTTGQLEKLIEAKLTQNN